MLKNGYQSRFIPVHMLDFKDNCLSQLFIFDRKKSTILTYPDCHNILRIFRGGAIDYPGYTAIPYMYRTVPEASPLNIPNGTLVPLDSNYVAGTSGDAVGGRFVAFDDLTLEKLYFFITSFGGTAANVNDISLEIRAASGLNPDLTAPGLLYTASITPSTTAARWNSFDSINLALTKNTRYFAFVGDPDGNGTDFARLPNSFTSTVSFSYPFINPAILNFFSGFSTANGGTTLSFNIGSCQFIFVFSDGTIVGSSLAVVTAPNQSNIRGLHCVNGLPFTIVPRIGILNGSNPGTTTCTGAKVWTLTNGPASGHILSSTASIKRYDTSGNIDGFIFTGDTEISANTPFRLGFSFSGSVAQIGKFTIAPTGDEDLRLAMPGRGNYVWTEDVTNVWTDDLDGFPTCMLFIDEIESPTSYLPMRMYPTIPTERTHPIYGV